MGDEIKDETVGRTEKMCDDVVRRFQTGGFLKVLEYDMLRLALYDKIKSSIEAYRAAFSAEPLWVRVSFDLLTRAGKPVFLDGEKVCGLLFRTAIDEKETIEVGASCIAWGVSL